MVFEAGCVLSDAVRQFVADHVNGDGEAVEMVAIAVAEEHLLAVPFGIVVLLAIVNGADQRQAVVIEGIAPEGRLVKLVGGAQAVVGFIGGRIATCRISLAPDLGSRQARSVVCSVNGAVKSTAACRHDAPEVGRESNSTQDVALTANSGR